MRPLLPTISLLLLCLHASSQNDTIIPSKTRQKIAESNNHEYYVSNKTIPDSRKYINDFIGLILGLDKAFESQYAKKYEKYDIDDRININNCTIYEVDPRVEFKMPFASSKIFRDDVNLSKISLKTKNKWHALFIFDSKFEQELNIDSSRFQWLHMEMSAANLMYMKNDTLSGISISNMLVDDGADLWFSGIKFENGQNEINIKGSNIRGIDLENFEFRTLLVDGHKDTISGRFELEALQAQDPKKSQDSNTIRILFRDCYINCQFLLNKFAAVQNLTFRNCTFGPEANLYNITIDTLLFVDCNKLPPAMNISTTPNSKFSSLQFENTDFSEAKLIYKQTNKLIFPGVKDNDQITNSYEALLEKFKRESKYDSYRTLDIEYKEDLALHGGISQKSANFLNKIWWNYGYSKSYIIYWTMAFLLLFFILNSLLWKSIQLVYPFDVFVVNTGPKRIRAGLRRYALIFLYTSFIFFSIKIELNKLKFTSTRWVAFFFLQYVVGLICVFFIFNAILKF